MKKLITILLLTLILPIIAIGSSSTDSLLNLISTTKWDTTKVICYEQLGANYRNVNEDSAILFNQQAIDVAENIGDKNYLAEAYREYALTAQAIAKYPIATEYYKKCLSVYDSQNDKRGIGESYNDIGVSYYYSGDYKKARENFELSGEYRLEIGDSIGSGQAFNNTGIMYDISGQPKKAIKLYLKALNIYEHAQDTNLIIGTISNIGLIYVGQKNYPEAIKIYEKQKKLAQAINSKQHYAHALTSIGTVYDYLEEYLKARKAFYDALEIFEELNNKPLISQCYNNLSVNHELTNDNEIALKFALKSIKLKEEIGIKGKLAISQIAAGKVYGKLNQHNKSMEMYKAALENASKTNYYDYIIKSHKGLSLSYSSLGRFKDAFKHQSKFIELNDSILNEENTKIINELEQKYENEKKQKEIELLNKNNELKDVELEKKNEETKRKTLQLYFAIAGALILLIFALVVLKNIREKKKTNSLLIKKNDEISLQKLIVEEKNREITDSITYAKRIQSAILPPQKLVKEYLQDSFILYKPKDIVAGDFYWMESIMRVDKKDPLVLFAAADCTGHGVPGAMVSVVCNNGLNRSVREHGLSDPGEILTKTREIVVAEFEKSEEEVKDGMDIAICSLEGNTLKYAGAHNPLWIIRNGELLETKANKQPIGKFDNPEPYSTHTIELQKGDSIYIFSDGYADQFGGEKGKKLKTTNFKKLLLSIQNENMQTQKQLIDQDFEKWKGELEQLDDVCVIGVRI